MGIIDSKKALASKSFEETISKTFNFTLLLKFQLGPL